jgi:hypothetical protein
MPFGSLWLPVILSAVAVFLVSAVLHMVLTYHKRGYKQLPNEDAVRATIGGALAPGLYVVPYCSDMKKMAEPEMKKKFVDGPVAMLTIRPRGEVRLGKHLAQYFAFTLLVSFVAAYVARHTLVPGASGMEVLRITGTIAFGIYGLGHMTDAIWEGEPWANTLTEIVDGAIYGVVTGLVFMFLWPSP